MSYIGHDDAWAEWRAALGGPRMHHGWMLAGKKGLGKAAFAIEAARELITEEGVAGPAGVHPDIIVLRHLPLNKEEEKKKEQGKPYQLKRNITVDQIRAMQQRLNTRATLGSRRAIIIDPADDMEKGASNALLKSLEEPPIGSFFILVTHRPGRLLPTIRSRCRMLTFPQLDNDQLDMIVGREAPEADQATRSAAIAASGGSPGAALDFVAMDLGKLHTLMLDIACNGDPDFVLRGRLADAMGARPDRQKQLAAVELARAVTAEQMRSVNAKSVPGLVHAHSELSRLTAQVPTYNFDPGLLVMEIGSLLTNLAASREPANG